MAVLPIGINPATGGGGAGGYQIERSLRFNSADSAYLNRTPASAGNRKTWTWSGWVKRSTLGTVQGIFDAYSGGLDFATVFFNTDNTIYFYSCYNSGSFIDYDFTTTAVFRDVGAWYHIVLVLNTVSATQADRFIVYVNGVRQAGTNPSGAFGLNEETYINSTVSHRLGSRTDGSYYSNGYMTEVNFINGQALTPSSFGETDSATGVWKPKAYSGTYGTNGFYLKFADNSGTTSTTLGKDSSGNGNNWTPNNFSVTAGAGNDSLVDSPTNYGTDTGVGGEVRGNYGTWNPLAKGSNTTLSNGNLNVLGSTNSTGNNNFSTFIPSSEKWYFEVSPANTYSYSYVGVSLDGNLSTSSNFVGATASSVGIELGTGAVWRNNSNQGTGGTGVSAGETLMVAFEPSSGKVWAGRNGTWYNSGNPAAGTGQVATIPTVGAIGPAVSPYSSSGTLSFNFGQRAFAYTAPSGFKALCTTNLPTPTIGATSTTQANDYFNAVTYTGNATSRSITGVGFQPDFVWIKNRTTAFGHLLYDAIRGTGVYLASNSTAADTSFANGLTSFDSDGFGLGTASAVNENSSGLVAWNWNAGGSTVTNTSGTISAQVRANTTAGFSVLTFTGGGAGSTIGHGLGAVPRMIIVKDRVTAGSDWCVYTSTTGAGAFLKLNTTAASATDTTMWGNTTPTSTVFTWGYGSGINYVAYCFAPVAGYSAFGSYTGNGSTDGPFVYTGFRPKFVMTKRTDSISNWSIHDSSRATYNLTINELYPDTSDAEYTGTNDSFDFLSNGFKARAAGTPTNTNGGTYIYAAFAESPFKYSLAR